MKRVAIIAAWAFCNALVIEPAAAADFTLKVPLHIQNLDEHITGVRVFCRVYGKYLDGHYAAVEGGPLPVALDTNTGNVDTVFEFPLNINRTYADPRDIDRYECTLDLDTSYRPFQEMKNCNSLVQLYSGNTVKAVAFADSTKPCVAHIQGSFTAQ